MADSDRVLASVYGLEIVAPAAYVTGAAGVPRLDLVAALAAAAGGGGGAAVTIVETAANFSAEVGTHYEVNTSGAGVTGTVPDPSLIANIGREFTVVKTDASVNTVTLSGALINGSASPFVISFQNSAATLRSTGTMWRVI